MKKLKQVQLAKQLGISKSYLSMILSGQRKAPESICSQLPVNFQAKLCLEGRNSTTELLPHILYLASTKPVQLLGIPELS